MPQPVSVLDRSPVPRGIPEAPEGPALFTRETSLTSGATAFWQGRAPPLRVPLCIFPQAAPRGGEKAAVTSSPGQLPLPGSSQQHTKLCSEAASVRLRHQIAFSEKQRYKQRGRFPGLSTKAYFTGNVVETVFIGHHLKWN